MSDFEKISAEAAARLEELGGDKPQELSVEEISEAATSLLRQLDR